MRSEELWYRLAAMIFFSDEQRSPAFVYLSTHTLSAQRPLHFTNHVGDGALDVPHPFARSILRYPRNVWHIVSTHHGTSFTIWHVYTTSSLSKRAVEGASPYKYSSKSCHRKIALLGAGAQLWSAMPIPHS